MCKIFDKVFEWKMERLTYSIAKLDDLNHTFTFRPNEFDLIQSRLVAEGINRERWPTYMRDIVSSPCDFLYELVQGLRAPSSEYKLTRIAIADIREREIGQLNQENVSKLLGSFSLFPFTQRLRMAIEEWLVLIAHARSEARNPAFKAYFPL
ncbi:hypothetical protein GP486_000700 [Trichoglossum hirsutum]|uniref:Uncharacterized protein n=1 Tax=Trichoglossum hirsutum TaxID=265104 RepID=A0A9P8LI28_9PEZI|nr:hypothetical protein GP486_000700 [Trichoglossum hirsutum]